MDFGCLVIDNEECLLNIYILVLHVYLLRACKHTGIHIGGSSACPGLEMIMFMMMIMIIIIMMIIENNDDFKDSDYIGRTIVRSDWATTVTACVFLDLECWSSCS